MKAVRFAAHGAPDVLVYTEDAPRPAAGAGEVLVRQQSTGMNYVDTLVRRGYPGISLPLPHTLGCDIAGEITALGEGVTGWHIGDRVLVYPLLACGTCQLCQEGQPHLCLGWRVLGMHTAGAYQEYVAVPAANLLSLPEEVSCRDAASLPVAGLTAYHGLIGVGNLQPGQTFFMWGGSGGLGSIAVQLAKQAGARVVCTVGSAAKVKVVESLGADLVLNRRSEDVAARVRSFAPHGVDLLLDYVGPETFPTSFELVKKGGTILLCGIITGRETQLSLHQTYLRHLSIRGLYMGTQSELGELVKLLAASRLTPLIPETPPLSEAALWHERLEAGEVTGKVVFEF